MAPAMHLLWALLIHLTGVLAVPTLNQSPISDPVSAGQTARLECGLQNGNVGSYYVYWYRQTPGVAPVWVIRHDPDNYIYRGTGFTDRFQPSRDTSANKFILTIGSVVFSDSAVYYCQTWDSSAGYIFGPGTTLNILSSEARSPSVLLLPPSSEEVDSGSATLSCLVSRFKPGSAQVLWSIDGKDTESGVTTGVVSPDSDHTYTLSSYLSVPAADWNKGSTYSCKISHSSLNSPLLRSISATACSD
ncbi:immunoglobulin lambda-1 light chain-like [Heptranchias perlo]|uniref:immunoglobulin lambda-1 light chain-like n=1 Tax=Heptranchias perlo TaxID=212740 RepID=UPI0035596FDF